MATPNEQTRDLPAFQMRGAFAPSSVDVEARTAELVWTTGAAVKRGGFWTEPYWEELSLDPKHVRMGRLNNGAPLLAAHNSYDLSGVLGVVESARLEKTRGVATVRFARAEDNPEADRAFRMVKDGILQNVSVGYRVYKLEQTEDGRARDDKTPVLLAVDWEPMELSVVPMGADDGAGFRSAKGDAQHPMNPCVVITRDTSTKEPNMSEQTTTPKPNPSTEQPVTPAAPIPLDGARAIEQAVQQAAAANVRQAKEAAELAAKAEAKAREDERVRVAEIQSLVRRHGLGDELENTLIRTGAPLDQVRAAVLMHLGARSAGDEVQNHTSFIAGDDSHDKFIRGGCASIFARAGTAGYIEAAKKNPRFAGFFRNVDTDPGEFSGMKLYDLARASLERKGVSVRGLHGVDLVKRALEYRDAGMQTTSDFAVLLETAVNKTFLGRYATIPVTWRMWCGIKSVQDFRTASFYRPGSFGVLDSVGESGEVKHKNIPDGVKRTLTPGTKGNIVGITRRAIVNDDLGVFQDTAAELGLAAAVTVESDAWALITANSGLGVNYDANPLFHATRNNIGPSGAMSVTTLDGGRAKMALQKDPAGNQYLVLRPHCWLGPVELGGQIKVFNSSAADPTDNKNAGVANRVKGLFDDAHVIDSPYLSAASATRHYLLADPALAPVFAVGFVDGQEAPTVTSQSGFEYDGVQFKIILDYGVGVLDFRGAITCPGA